LRTVNPAELRRLAAELDEKAKTALRAGKAAEAELFVQAAWKARDMADKREQQLLARDQHGTTTEMVNPARVRISAGADEDPDELVAKANAAGYTLRSLAEAVKCSHVLLSQARRGKRSIRRAIVDDVERLTGFKATRANWPGGIRD
jgi:hypothetical protein